MTTTTGSTTHTPTAASATGLSVRRLNVMRAGYLFMGLGLVAVKWPLLPDAHTLPLYEGVTVCVLVAMSLFALLGVRYPTKLLPLLLLEMTWKFIWLAVVALPTAIAGDLDAATTDVLVNCTFVVVIVAAIPWRYAWRRYLLEKGEPWRATGTRAGWNA
ncbi:hypothetical protein [Nocardioides sp. SR21]|uniref:hypothetical protein n=1 Tax=Nocardioides sp. SR21 TaxID=2919501 RepID=UPI001FA9CED8|nr:hypothetical protein [Nocardioides sp. SR21]